jgi:hypothetical protein
MPSHRTISRADSDEESISLGSITDIEDAQDTHSRPSALPDIGRPDGANPPPYSSTHPSAPLPSHDRRMVAQTTGTFERATARTAAIPATPVLPAGTPSESTPIATVPTPSGSNPTVAATTDADGDAPAKRRPGRPRKPTADANAGPSSSVQRTASVASVSEEPRRGTIAWGVQQLQAARDEMNRLYDDIVDRVDDSTTTAESCRVEIQTLVARLDRMGKQVRVLAEDIQALRDERQNVIFDTGSESEDVPVRKSGPKRRGASPRLSRPTKRSHPTHGSDSDSSDGAPPAVRRRPNPVPLEQRISDARTVYADDMGDIAPALSPSPPSSPTKRAAPAPPISTRTPAQPPAHIATAVQQPQRLPTAVHHATAPAPHPSSSMRPQDHAGSSHRDEHHQSSARRGSSRGRGGDYGRGRGAKGKGRARDTDVAPALDNSRAPVIVGKVAWGSRSRDVFIDFCGRIEACGYGPAPTPAYVSHPDKESFVRASYTGSQTETALEQAEMMVAAWNEWCKTSKPHANTVAYLAD